MKHKPTVKPSNAAAEPNARPQGRPRSDVARQAVLQAAREILETEGFVAITIEKVAARAGVGKPTIYRTWPNALAVAMAALLETSHQAVTPADPVSTTGQALDALRQHIRATATVFASRSGRQVAMLLAAADQDSELAKVFRNHFVQACRDEGRALLEQAIAAGELRANLDREIALDVLYAPVFYRLLVRQGTLDAKFADTVFEHAIAGLQSR